MFTGIVGARGSVAAITSTGDDARLQIAAGSDYLQGLQEGDSVAVSGVCLTALQPTAAGFLADVSVETLDVTTARGWRVGTPVNLERALTPATALGGHLVLGHVDGRARLASMHDDGRSRRLVFDAPAALSRYIAEKGSVALDGVSLTVNAVDGARFGVNIIPVTQAATTLGALTVGNEVNLEVDVVARYVARLLRTEEEQRG